MAMQRRKRTVKNARLSDELVWRIKEYITNDQWSPRQISGYVKKSTNMLFMQKLPFGKLSKPLAKVVRNLLLPYKDCLKTITTDNGSEFAAHKDITRFLGVPVYFADPYCS